MDHADKLRAELEAIEKVKAVMDELPDDTTRKRVLRYVSAKVKEAKAEDASHE